MKPKIWGRYFWNVLFYLEIRLNSKDFYRLLKLVYYVLPCVNVCRPNYKKHLSSLTKKSDEQKKWLRKVHKKTSNSKIHKVNHETYRISVKKTLKYIKIEAHEYPRKTSNSKIHEFAKIIKLHL